MYFSMASSATDVPCFPATACSTSRRTEGRSAGPRRTVCVPPAGAVSAVRFDARRNWAFVRALLSDPESEVQWIFIHRGLAAALLHEATRAGDDPALVARASFIMKQPSDAEVHDDHMHIRFYCAPADRSLGCVDKGPVRWWKKMWKYMGVPYGRPPAETVGPDAIAAFGRLFRGELPLTFVAGDATS